MPTETEELQNLADREYRWGFVTDIESESAPPGLSEDTVRFISKKKNEPQWMLDWRPRRTGTGSRWKSRTPGR